MVGRCLTTDSAKAVIHALTAGRLDYCNNMLYQININATKTLQTVLYAAACLIVWKRKFDSNTSTLRDDLYWLPVPPQMIIYKLCIITYRCLHQTAPKNLQELCVTCQWQPLRVAVTCTQLLVLIYISSGNKNCHLRCECSQTLEQFTTPTPRLDTIDLHNSSPG